MTHAPNLRLSLAVFALTSFVLVASVPTAAAEAGSIKCNPEPLGPAGEGLVGEAKRFGNPVIYGACIFASNVAADVIVLAGEVIVLVVDGVNLVCEFATGNPCITVNYLPA